MSGQPESPRQRPSAAVLVEIFPIGRPGYVRHEVRSAGGNELSNAEMIRTLRTAADALEQRAADAAAEHGWTAIGCAGLSGGCPQCRQLYRLGADGVRGQCVLCGGRHWPWEPHHDGDTGDDSGTNDSGTNDSGTNDSGTNDDSGVGSAADDSGPGVG